MDKKTNIIIIVIFILLMMSLVLFYLGIIQNKKNNTKPSTTNTPTIVDDNNEENNEDNSSSDESSLAFEAGAKDILVRVKNQWINDSSSNVQELTYSKCEEGCNNIVDAVYNYFIKIDSTGKVIKYYVTDGIYQFGYEGEDLQEDNIIAQEVSTIDENMVITIRPDM